jgi:hypothetical protein
MAMDVVVGYSFLWQSSVNADKLPVTRKWIIEADIRSKMNLDLITTGDKTTITHFKHITGEPQAIGT